VAYDISIMSTDANGRVTYKLPDLSHKISGKDKLVQHFIKNLYDDKIGGLIRTLKEERSWSEGDIVDSVHKTVRYMQANQAGKELSPDEKITGANITRLSIERRSGKVDLVIAIKSAAGIATITL